MTTMLLTTSTMATKNQKQTKEKEKEREKKHINIKMKKRSTHKIFGIVSDVRWHIVYESVCMFLSLLARIRCCVLKRFRNRAVGTNRRTKYWVRVLNLIAFITYRRSCCCCQRSLSSVSFDVSVFRYAIHINSILPSSSSSFITKWMVDVCTHIKHTKEYNESSCIEPKWAEYWARARARATARVRERTKAMSGERSEESAWRPSVWMDFHRTHSHKSNNSIEIIITIMNPIRSSVSLVSLSLLAIILFVSLVLPLLDIARYCWSTQQTRHTWYT